MRRWIVHQTAERNGCRIFQDLVATSVNDWRARGTRTFARPGCLHRLEVVDVDTRQMTERIRTETIVRTNRNGKEAAVIRHDRAVFFQREQDGFLFDRPRRSEE